MPRSGSAITPAFSAWDTGANAPKTGDAANLTVKLIRDGAEVTPAGAISEVGGGEYKVALTAGENTGTMMSLRGSSSTANVVIETLRWINDTETGSGDTAVTDANNGTDGNDLRYLTGAGAGVDNATIRAYLKTDYDAGNRSDAFLRGKTTTDSAGKWVRPLFLNKGLTYTLVFEKPGAFGPDSQEVLVP